MKRMSAVFAALSALVIGACGTGSDETRNASSKSIVVVGDFVANYPTMNVRGTMNAWGTTAMNLVSDHQWEAEITTPAGAQQIKFDVYGNWQENFGDSNGDHYADRDGQNIDVEGGKVLLVRFDDSTNWYWVEEKTYQANVSFALPSGVDPVAFANRQARLQLNGSDAGWYYIYVDGGSSVPYSPLSGLVLGGNYTMKFDAMVGTQRLVGEVAFTVDGSVNPLDKTMTVTEGSVDDYGSVELTVYADSWNGTELVSGTWADAGIYLGDWHAGNLLGRTGTDGKVLLSLPAGDTYLTMMVMTGSHSMASGEVYVTVVAGQTIQAALHMSSLPVVINAYYDLGMGNALYITGASDYLGNWRTAYKMSYSPWNGAWTFSKNLPVGLPFKVVRGPWVDGATISTSQVAWENGPDRIVTRPQYSYYTDISFTPSF